MHKNLADVGAQWSKDLKGDEHLVCDVIIFLQLAAKVGETLRSQAIQLYQEAGQPIQLELVE